MATYRVNYETHLLADLEELRAEAAAAKTWKERDALADRLKEELENIRGMLRDTDLAVRSAKRDVIRFGRSTKPDCFWHRMLKRKLATQALERAYRDEIKAGLSAHRAYEKWNDAKISRMLKRWDDEKKREAK